MFMKPFYSCFSPESLVQLTVVLPRNSNFRFSVSFEIREMGWKTRRNRVEICIPFNIGIAAILLAFYAVLLCYIILFTRAESDGNTRSKLPAVCAQCHGDGSAQNNPRGREFICRDGSRSVGWKLDDGQNVISSLGKLTSEIYSNNGAGNGFN